MGWLVKLQFKFLIPVLLLFGLFCTLFLYSEHQHSQTALEQTVRSQAQSLTNLIKSVRIVYHTRLLQGGLPLNPDFSDLLPSHTMKEISAKLSELSTSSGAEFRSLMTTPFNTMVKASNRDKKAFSFFSEHPDQREYLEPFSLNGELFYQYSSPTFLGKYCFSCHPESTQAIGSLNGILAITLSAQQLKNQAQDRQLDNLIIILISLAVCCVATVLLFNRMINKKLTILHNISYKNRSDHYVEESSTTGTDELDALIQSMTKMSDEIKTREADLLAAYEFSTTILSNISDAVCVIDPTTQTIIAANSAFFTLHNTTHNEAVGAHCHDISACTAAEQIKGHPPCPGCYAARHKVPCREERMRTVDGQNFYYDVCVSPIFDQEGETIQVVRVARDITQAKLQEKQISQLAYFDPLTGLPNRTLFHDRLEQALLLSSRDNTCGIIAFLDLDNFKGINDRFGHSAGDRILKIVADRLKSCVRESDTVARMCGDEFLIIYHNSCENEHAKNLAENLLRALAPPITIDNEQVTTSASIGLCFFPKDGQTVDELLKCTDEAMYKAKHAGRNTYHINTHDNQPTLF